MEKNKKPITLYEDLIEHPFVKQVLQDALLFVKNKDLSQKLRQSKPIFNKNEAYILFIAQTLFSLLTIYEHLTLIPIYLKSFSLSEEIKKEGVTQHFHVLLCIENYIIKTQSLYDRMLQLVDVVFNIYNPSNQINHNIIIHNLHVKNSGLPSALQKLKKLVKKYSEDRNKIIHRECYRDKGIPFIKALEIIPEEGNYSFKKELKSFSIIYVKNKIKEFEKMNTNIFVAVGNIFGNLIERYKKQKEEDELIYGKIEVLEKNP
jgi:hypothetical protein